MIIFKRIEAHYITSIADPSQVESLKIIIMGTAGTGKSHLIQAIRCRLLEIARNKVTIVNSCLHQLGLQHSIFMGPRSTRHSPSQ